MLRSEYKKIIFVLIIIPEQKDNFLVVCLRSFPSIALRIPTAHNSTRD